MFARVLSEAGAQVLLVEAGGHNIDHDIRHHQWPWEHPYRNVYQPDEEYTVRLPVTQHVVGQGERQAITTFDGSAHNSYYNDHFWAKRRDWKYTFPQNRPYRWVRVRAIGGKTNCWDANTGRCGPYIWKPASYDGFDVDWPVDYDEMAPWYSKVERMIGVSGPDTQSVDFPYGDWLPPTAMRCAEAKLAAAARKKFGLHVFSEPKAAITRDFNGRPACHYCGRCSYGCDPGSKFTTAGVMLPAAFATGRLTLLANSIVSGVLTDAEGRARGVSYVDRYTFQEGEALGRVVVLAASPIETARIMLNSTSGRFPDGIANSSGQLGRNLVENMTASVHGYYPDFRDREVTNDDGWSTGVMLAPLTNTNARNRNKNFIRSYTLDIGGGFGMAGGGVRGDVHFGSTYKREARAEYGWGISVAGSGEGIRSDQNYVDLDPNVKDAWGIPAARIQMAFGENEKAMVKDIIEWGVRLIEAAGGEVTGWQASPSIPGGQITEQGTCRMGHDARKFVTNPWAQCHDVPNLVIGDGAINVTPASQNPTLTILALAMRNASHLAEIIRRGDLRI
jgi:choline dehydrogenase-like flavoprotein